VEVTIDLSRLLRWITNHAHRFWHIGGDFAIRIELPSSEELGDAVREILTSFCRTDACFAIRRILVVLSRHSPQT